MSARLSAQDKKDLDKFTKFLALKSAQIIVQSRMGEKISTKCNPESSGTDWVSILTKPLLLLSFGYIYGHPNLQIYTLTNLYLNFCAA